ncbi:hypothetical protein B0T10DRAFT_590573 [Thelonectria olida]|uniref:Uncharacterized protein n=1 Tax=Thelonectria olida TaxID=1576542 RepID=A0A9P8VPZ0_9HYPO|nr:hypothetical protein B0T10DRAFT_590573 [Thelonectria olida]
MRPPCVSTRPAKKKLQVVPNCALGKVLLPKHQGFPTSVGLLKTIWDSHVTPELISMFTARTLTQAIRQAQNDSTIEWFTDVVDIARIHVASLLFPEVQGERLISYEGCFNINDLLHIFREVQPNRTFPDDVLNFMLSTQVDAPCRDRPSHLFPIIVRILNKS